MLVLQDDGVEQYRNSEIGSLVKILIFQFKHNSEEIKYLQEKFGGPVSRQKIEEVFPEYYERAIISTVFAGMVLEALLYDYALEIKSKTFADKVSREMLECELKSIYKEVVSDDTQEIIDLCDKLKEFRHARKYYVHNKSMDLIKNPKEKLNLFNCYSSLKMVYEVAVKISLWSPKYDMAKVLCYFLQEAVESTRGYRIELK